MHVGQDARARQSKATKFDSYAEFERAGSRPSRRTAILAIRRGETEGVLRVALEVDTAPIAPAHRAHGRSVNAASPWAGELREAVDDALTRLLLPHGAERRARRAEDGRRPRRGRASSPRTCASCCSRRRSAPKAVLGIDPGQRTGCKCAVVDETGKMLEHATIYLVQGDEAIERARARRCCALCQKHQLRVAIAVGNGTHGRETEAFVRDVLASARPEGPFCVPVSESGASVYSASDVAREEFPDLDLTVRGAISIARRLQDPLAELVKVDPKSIGVGQYQHDVYQALLAQEARRGRGELRQSGRRRAQHGERAAARARRRHRALAGEEDRRAPRQARALSRAASSCSRCRGLGPRDVRAGAPASSAISRRRATRSTRSAVHPERYALVERMANDLGVPIDVAGRQQPELVDKHRCQALRRATDVGAFTLERHRRRAEEAGARSARDLRAAEVPRRRAHARGSQAGHGARGRGHQRHRVRRVRRRRRAPGRPGPRVAARRSLRARIRARS